MIILKISKNINKNFLLTLSIIIPANNARNTPGAVDVAMIIPKDISEFVFSSTSQLIAIRLIPKPISDMMFPIKNKKNVLFFKIFIKIPPYLYLR
tara:strand:- start:615 stop:899 length:285 start_codon:yes stop_codon:yes gene_type:complete